MTGRVIRFPIADPLETALVAATELDREQLEQLRDQVAALLAASCPPAPAPVVKSKPERPPFLGGLPQGPRGGGSIEWKRIRHGDKVYEPYPYLRLRIVVLRCVPHTPAASSCGQEDRSVPLICRRASLLTQGEIHRMNKSQMLAKLAAGLGAVSLMDHR
jgi:hypothetical protein